jgi:hypothetical protein
MNHTPGKWDYQNRPSGNCLVYNDKGGLIAGVKAGTMCEANARLIAVAPQMLQALKRILNLYDAIDIVESPILREAQEIIAKVEADHA